MFPSNHLVTNGWRYARTGDEYIIYLISGGARRLRTCRLRTTATWFNPRNGMQHAAAGGPTFTAPDGNDWALHIRAAFPGTFTLSASPASVGPGGTVTVTWSGVDRPTVKDWIGRYTPSANDGAYLDWKYTSSCSKVAGATPQSSGSCNFTMPATPGTLPIPPVPR
jgi:hypothetical protein